uniref:Ovule protein n=1 Tax=Brugia timori TaxID=42155 RepID=A0A0R3R6J8_9BILA
MCQEKNYTAQSSTVLIRRLLLNKANYLCTSIYKNWFPHFIGYHGSRFSIAIVWWNYESHNSIFVFFFILKISVRFITEQIRALFRKMVEIEATCKPSDFSLDFQKLKAVQLPLTSLHSECGKNQMKVAEAPKKKMSLDEYKRRKSSKTTADSEK